MSDLVHWPPTWSMLLLVPALFIGFTVHELGHVLVAHVLGDTSQLERNRLSWNPLRHVCWSGMVVYLLLGFGWAKPLVVDPTRFRLRQQSFATFLVALAGSAANLLVALLVGIGLTMTFGLVVVMTGAPVTGVVDYFAVPDPALDTHGLVVAFSTYVLTVNLVLGIFNLLPIPSLDGFQALISLYRTMYDALRAGRAPGGAQGQELARPRPPAGRKPAQPHVAAPSGAAPPAPMAASALDGEEPPTHPARIHFDIGLQYQRDGQLDEAIARYRQALAHDEHFDLAYYNLGLVYWAKGRLPLASSSFRAAMQSSRDVGVRIQSDLRIRELEQAQAGAQADLRPAPSPLEPDVAPPVVHGVAPSLDAMAVRQVWLRFAAGGVLALLFAGSVWTFVTLAALAAFS